ncbi:MAG: Asp-tRNA(Asn)/Glu-tRNA(Gln) amidotransferase GatCAB subunit B, partial [Bacteroidota bacterium]|nr:Asp-tRNA(Asn)/Glu-tRNA(Gln) amidotransferase GatCAB subunit B [Bacteroidota bacterium]
DEDDYRYFPEPDLPPFYISAEQIEDIRKLMPPLQSKLKEQLTTQYYLSDYDALQLTEEMELVNFFFEVTKETRNYKAAANWVIGPVKNYLAEENKTVDEIQPLASTIAQLISFIDKGVISFGIASQKIFPYVVSNPMADVGEYIKGENLQMQSADTISEHIEAALTKHAQKITEYKKGKKGLLSLFVGEVMKLSKGKANAEEVKIKIVEKLNQ